MTPAVRGNAVAPAAGPMDLAEELVGAAECADPIALLRAIAALDPLRAALWLREHQTMYLESAAALTLLVDDLVRAAVRRRDRELALPVAQLVSALPACGTVSTVTALASLLELAARVDLLGAHADRFTEQNGANADVLRLSAEHALAKGNYSRADWLIARLTRQAETPAGVQQASRLRAGLPGVPAQPAKIALLSSFTVDALAPFLVAECQAARIAPEIYIAPFNSWEREMRNAASQLLTFTPDVTFLLLAVDDLIPALSGGGEADQIDEAAATTIARVLEATQAFRDVTSSTLVVHLLETHYAEDFVVPLSRSRRNQLRSIYDRLEKDLSGIPNVYVRGPERVHDDPKLRHLARMRVTGKSLNDIARSYVRLIAAVRGLTRKCIVLDLDNTLWGGVIGEDGLSGIRLSNATPGSEYVEFQEYLRALIGRGVVLAVASKNNEADALEVFRNHDAMVLREQDFVATRINWLPKPENVRSIAEELGIGLDAIVFVDDNPDERALMRQTLPQVLTVEMPRDASLYRQTLEALPELHILRVTDEDRQRTEMYRARREREAARSTAISLDDFLFSLGIKVTIAQANAATTGRVHQLFQRTNQFNLTTRRYDAPIVESRRYDPAWRIYTLRARDRFSDHELVGTAMVSAAGANWHIENFVLSCRVIGYGIESAMLAAITADARSAGAATLTGEFIASAKNAPARDFFERHGFSSGAEAGDEQLWSLALTQEVPAPAWITIERTHGT